MDNKKRLIIASLVAQTVKNLPARQETWVRSLGWEDLLEKGMAAHSSGLENCLENSMNRGAWWLQSMGSQRVGHNWVTNTQLYSNYYVEVGTLLSILRTLSHPILTPILKESFSDCRHLLGSTGSSDNLLETQYWSAVETLSLEDWQTQCVQVAPLKYYVKKVEFSGISTTAQVSWDSQAPPPLTSSEKVCMPANER